MGMFHRVENGMVFCGTAHRMGRDPARCEAPQRTENGGVVALGAASGEDDLSRPAAKNSGYGVTSLVDRTTRLTGEAMRTRRVCIDAVEKWLHCLDGFGAHGRGRRMIEIDAVDRHEGNLPLPV